MTWETWVWIFDGALILFNIWLWTRGARRRPRRVVKGRYLHADGSSVKGSITIANHVTGRGAWIPLECDGSFVFDLTLLMDRDEDA